MEEKDLAKIVENISEIAGQMVAGEYKNPITPKLARETLKGIKEIVDLALGKHQKSKE